MSNLQVIREPTGALGVFDITTNTWAANNLTPDQVVEFYRADALARLERRLVHVRQITDWVLAGEADKAYYDFTVDYEEACKADGPAPAVPEP